MSKAELLELIEVKFEYLDFDKHPVEFKYGALQRYRDICELDGFIYALALADVLMSVEYDVYSDRIFALKDRAITLEMEYVI